MRQKTTTFLALIFCCCWGFGQEIVWNRDLSKIPFKVRLEEAFQIVDEDEGNIALFLKDKRNIYGFLLDSSFVREEFMMGGNLPSKYKRIIGNSVQGGKDYYLYLANNAKRKFNILRFSFTNKKYDVAEPDLVLQNEIFVEAFTVGEQMVMLTVTKFTSELNFYYFDGFEYTRKSLDLGQKVWFGDKEEDLDLYHRLVRMDGLANNITLDKIDENTPYAIESVSSSQKVYQKGDTVIFTLDGGNNYTELISINLLTLEFNMEGIPKPFTDTGYLTKLSTNSFIYENKLFNLSVKKDEMVFSIFDYKSRMKIKEFRVTKEDTISFKNTPIIQEGGYLEDYRELDRTKQFLRKMSSSEVGIAVYKRNGKYQITLGGKQSVSVGNRMMMPVPGMSVPMAGGGNTGIFVNPVYTAFYWYSYTKSVHIVGLFDENFNHLEGRVEENTFDRIKDYKKDSKRITAGTLFRYKDYFIMGEYSKNSGRYTLEKFKD
ncbi:hypothetical protein [Sinomicrobium sp. M5D2P9]